MEYKVDIARDIIDDLMLSARCKIKSKHKTIEIVSSETGLSKSTISRFSSKTKNVSAQVLVSLLLEADPGMELYLRQIPNILNKKEKSK